MFRGARRELRRGEAGRSGVGKVLRQREPESRGDAGGIPSTDAAPSGWGIPGGVFVINLIHPNLSDEATRLSPKQ